MSERYTHTGNGLQNDGIPSRETEGPHPKQMRVFVQPCWRIMVETPGLDPMPFGLRIQRGSPLPTEEFVHLNPYTAEDACEELQKYVDRFVLRLPEVMGKTVKVKADRR